MGMACSADGVTTTCDCMLYQLSSAEHATRLADAVQAISHVALAAFETAPGPASPQIFAAAAPETTDWLHQYTGGDVSLVLPPDDAPRAHSGETSKPPEARNEVALPMETRGVEWLSTAMSPESPAPREVDCEAGQDAADPADRDPVAPPLAELRGDDASADAGTGAADAAGTANAQAARQGEAAGAGIPPADRYALRQPSAVATSTSTPAAREAVAWEWLATMLLAAMQLVGLASLEHWQHDESAFVVPPL